MNSEVFYNIGKIIERDSKATTYKYALLRGVIDIIQDNSPYINFVENRVQIPIGLLIEKWLLYYYPILESQTLIPQINGESNLAFSKALNELITSYKVNGGGFSAFYNDLRNKGVPNNLQPLFFELTKKLRDTITRMPMKYIGRSISNEYYSIFDYQTPTLRRPDVMDIEYLISDFGVFSLPYEYYEAFKVLGSFINGQDSILFKWAEFSSNASRNHLSVNGVLNEVLKSPITERNVAESRKLYETILKKEGNVFCVWTGKNISNYAVDHLIPFSIWKNNDLWNLLPSDPKVNNQKRDKIPAPELIERQQSLILHYWEIIQESQKQRFQREIKVTLLGNHSLDSWKSVAIAQLQSSCHYLIENRGFEIWRI